MSHCSAGNESPAPCHQPAGLSGVPAALWRSNSLAAALEEEKVVAVAAGSSAPSSPAYPPSSLPDRFRRTNSLAAAIELEQQALAAFEKPLPGSIEDASGSPLKFFCEPRPVSAHRSPKQEESPVLTNMMETAHEGNGVLDPRLDADVPQDPGSMPIAASGVPRGGVAVDVDFGPKSRGPPPAVAARLAKSKSATTNSRGARSETQKATETVQSVDSATGDAAIRRGGVAVEVEFKPKSKGPPPAIALRLSRGGSAGSRSRQDIQPLAAEKFLRADNPIELLAGHDSIEFGDDGEGLLLRAPTTTAIRELCGNLYKVGADGVRQLLAWRLALLNEEQTGTVPTPAELEKLVDRDAHRQALAARQGNSGVEDATAGTAAGGSGAAMSQAQKAVDEAMSKLLGERVKDEDAAVLQEIHTDIEALERSLKEPGLSSAQTCRLRKQLNQRRSERARAERAVRQGRSAKTEVKGSSEEIRALLETVPTAIRSSSSAAHSSGPPRFMNELTPPESPLHGSRTTGFSFQASTLPPGFADAHALPMGSQELALSVLAHPETLACAGAVAIGRIGLLSKAFKDLLLDASDGAFGETAWRIACQALARERMLWCPAPGLEGQKRQDYWKKLFFDQLWPARGKWSGARNTERQRKIGELGNGGDEEPGQNFAIQVAVRFKPGTTSQGRLLVPLHQKLMIERSKKDRSAGLKIGDKEPPEFLDALMGHLMTDPVRLPGSGRVCDRKIIEAQLRTQRPKDPFDGSPLEVSMLEPQDELKARIAAWRSERRQEANDGGEKHKLAEDEVQDLVEKLGGNLDPEVVEAVLEAERLRAAGRSTLQGVIGQGNRKATNDEYGDGEEGADRADINEGAAEERTDGAPAEEVRAVPTAGPRGLIAAAAEAGEEELGEAPTREGPRVLAVSPPTSVVMFQPGAGVRPFVFARVFDDSSSQVDIYEQACRGSICAALNGFNACMLCYGQTGSGKTHTMFGQSIAMGGNAGAVVSSSSGCVIRALRDLFDAASELESLAGVKTSLSAQYVQIYQDRVACLQTGDAVALRESSPRAPVLLQGAAQVSLTGLMDAAEMIAQGESRKRYAETAMNHRSSRAHTVLVLKITQTRGDLESSSQLHLVDLAGSERVKKSKAQGGRFVEAVGINTSLMVLGLCISARVEAKPHVPYYESRLTLLLRSALGGDSRTNVVICCHKDDVHGDETLQALSFGERCSFVTNRAHAAMASSLSEALAAVDAACEECVSQISGLEQRGKGSLPACERLRSRLATLQQKRRHLADRAVATAGAEAGVDKA
eukprot:TRINITY_DN4577_c0_g1_i1.p1 TRINITY_DN4577_c0_g1~~TRINITY_DN4577_c0_g1_i1.p1  ORF type:complete len:1292 (-),score=258.80 TRINITY_DN4577_c0_g1_i1:678-4553(-)